MSLDFLDCWAPVISFGELEEKSKAFHGTSPEMSCIPRGESAISRIPKLTH